MQAAVDAQPSHYYVASPPGVFGTEDALAQLMADWGIAAPAGLALRRGKAVAPQALAIHT